jgi:probable addiction module antidote protein
MRKTSSYRDALLESLRDADEAQEYLNAALEDSPEAFLKALKNVAQAHQMTKVAKESGVQRETLYRSLSEQGNPTFGTLSSILTVLGLTITVKAKNETRSFCTTVAGPYPTMIGKIGCDFHLGMQSEVATPHQATVAAFGPTVAVAPTFSANCVPQISNIAVYADKAQDEYAWSEVA